MDGVEGPSLQSEGQRRMFLEEMERVCNERFRPGGVIKVSLELESFIKLADGVVDLDFRYDGICGFSLFHGGTGKGLKDQTAREWSSNNATKWIMENNGTSDVEINSCHSQKILCCLRRCMFRALFSINPAGIDQRVRRMCRSI